MEQKVDPLVTHAIEADVQRAAWAEWAKRPNEPIPNMPLLRANLPIKTLYAMFVGVLKI